MTARTLIEKQYRETNCKNGWPEEFNKIVKSNRATKALCTIAKLPSNRPFNRYRDVNPFDHSRVTLSTGQYINASIVQCVAANRKYILTQGPLSTTVGHFWKMVWEQNSTAIIMLNRIIEKGETKCHWYWPTGNGLVLQLDDFQLSVEQINEDDFSHYTIRTLKLTEKKSEECRLVTHYHFTSWPDFGVPSSPKAFLEFLHCVRCSGALEPDVGPAVVHCSAGIGRSGTFCLVDAVLTLMESSAEREIDVQEILLEMRTYRMGLIQTPEQLKFSYLAILEGSGPKDDNERTDPSISSEHSEVREECDDEEEEEPPVPPPRVTSLNSSRAPPESKSSPSTPTFSPEAKLPPPPEVQSVELEKNEMRRRKKELNHRIADISKRMKESEKRMKRNHVICKSLSVALGVLVTGIALYAYFKR